MTPSEPPDPFKPDPAALARWFRVRARDLPWRTELPGGGRDPWASLVSEFMLQQTQVARVAERFGPVLARFPTPASMAASTVEDVLSLWAGLGYYRRARLLHAASREIVARFGGLVPSDTLDLRSLPGVGPYTAGAIASIAFGLPRPLVDGNVARVLQRVHARPGCASDPGVMRWAWKQAGLLISAAAHRALPPAQVNEGLMELGATICTPAAPRCGECPLAASCLAHAKGAQARVPRAKDRAARAKLSLHCAVLLDARGRVLMHQRPPGGLWSGLWQPPTHEALPPALASLPVVGEVTRLLTHRRVVMVVRSGRKPRAWRAPAGSVWVARPDLAALGVGSAHRAVLELALRAPRGTPRPRRR
ncbi:MAG: A/G-specific adenine glycosylase [Phycisphaerales bacterium]|nr:A/G-specific adenine glycosylase [Phycisphaerales bacterium]